MDHQVYEKECGECHASPCCAEECTWKGGYGCLMWLLLAFGAMASLQSCHDIGKLKEEFSEFREQLKKEAKVDSPGPSQAWNDRGGGQGREREGVRGLSNADQSAYPTDAASAPYASPYFHSDPNDF